MKIKVCLLTIAILSLLSFGVKAQEVTCDAFCITEVHMDTATPNLMLVTLFFTGGNDDFINYPYIAEVIDEQGDTVGTGTLNFFGQFGNTTNDYPVTVEFETIPDNFRATMVFHYDTSVCALSFPCTTNGIELPFDSHLFSIYPNPITSETAVHSEIPFHDLEVTIFNSQGGLVKQLEHQRGTEIALQFDDIVSGIYVVQLMEGKKVIGMRKVVVRD